MHQLEEIKLIQRGRYEALWKDRPRPWFAATHLDPESIVYYAGNEIVFRGGPETLRIAGYLSGVDGRNLHLHLFHTLCYTTKSQQAAIRQRFNKLSAAVPSVHGSRQGEKVYLYFQSEAELNVGRSHYKRAIILPPLIPPENDH